MTPQRRLTRRRADRMLDAPGAVPGDPVADVLAAASAPAVRGAVAGEERVAAFFKTGGPAGARPCRAPALVRAGRSMVAAPLLSLGMVGLAAGGGFALAASQGAIDVPFTGHDNRSDRAPEAPTTTNPGLAHTGGTHPAEPGATPDAGASSTPGTNASPDPSFRGLCRAYQNGGSHAEKDNPAFTALNAAAGGIEHVATYCVDLIGPPTEPTRAAHPVRPTHAADPTHGAHPTHAAGPTEPPVHTTNPHKPSKTPKASRASG